MLTGAKSPQLVVKAVDYQLLLYTIRSGYRPNSRNIPMRYIVCATGEQRRKAGCTRRSQKVLETGDGSRGMAGVCVCGGTDRVRQGCAGGTTRLLGFLREALVLLCRTMFGNRATGVCLCFQGHLFPLQIFQHLHLNLTILLTSSSSSSSPYGFYCHSFLPIRCLHLGLPSLFPEVHRHSFLFIAVLLSYH